MAALLLLHHRHLGLLDVAVNAVPFDLGQLGQIGGQLGRALGPPVPPCALRLVPVVHAERIGMGRAGGVGLGAARAVGVRRGVVGVPLGPEAIPAPLPAAEGKRRLGDRREVAEPGADVDPGPRAEARQLLLDARILLERLDEAADRKLRRQIHLRFERMEPARREALDDPRAVLLERELRLSDQEGVRAEPVERFEPAFRRFKIGRERGNVGRPWGDDPPTEDSDSTQKLFLPGNRRSLGMGSLHRIGGLSPTGARRANRPFARL